MLLDHNYSFSSVKHFRSYIKVFGVGGGGCNAVRHMFNQTIEDVDFIVCNTDRQSLDESPIDYKIQLGNQTVNQKGIGAGMDAAQGRAAAEESEAEIRKVLEDNTEMLFITAGMGGGTGTGAAPVIARIANDLNILTVAIVTAPFDDEGEDKIAQAREGIRELQKYCDTVVVILNEKLLELYPDMTVDEAYAKADDVLANAARCISEIVTKSGKINSDMNDVKTILKGAGQAVIGLYTAEGDDRAVTCVEEALSSPLLDNRDIKGAKRILITISYSKDCPMRMMEQKAITKFIEDRIGGKARLLKISPIPDDSLGKAMRFTIIAAGFDLPGNSVYQRPMDEPVSQAPKLPSYQNQPVAAPVVAPPVPVVEAAPSPVANYGFNEYRRDTPEPSASFTPETSFTPEVSSVIPEAVVETPIMAPSFTAPAPTLNEEDKVKHIEQEIWREEDLSSSNARMIQEFVHKLNHPDQGWEADLETPAYIRQNIPLADLMVILNGEKVNHYNLND
ncbi:cell division protein FtsZ [Siphonobacter sp. BAB-5385]|uniref:cell division protein FtsZ n=1 Tax=unclassified Siphonobacter TaxID=2635712 RepID=UPI000B9E577C|nr:MULTISPECIES: cell division protein FtsZ [unclassified Siphonobacter]OZI05553.1 cell division protein FtsZ [Siphonobacter sp. BAB-5385]PMD95885.1 cell division protein FtsZ [Siphonobacter sp. BAB-5405]